VPVAAAVPAFAASDEKLIGLLNRYRAEIYVLNHHSRHKRSGTGRRDRASELPVTTMAGAVAVISHHIDEPELVSLSTCGDEFRELLHSARHVLEGGVA
jgi:hypothetical protein